MISEEHNALWCILRKRYCLVSQIAYCLFITDFHGWIGTLVSLNSKCKGMVGDDVLSLHDALLSPRKTVHGVFYVPLLQLYPQEYPSDDTV